MKKMLLCFLAAGFFACNSNKTETTAAAVNNTDLVQMNLKGKVQAISEMVTNFDSVGKVKPDSSTNEYAFDEKGYLTKYNTKDSAGKVSYEQTTKRNADGSFAEITNMKYGKMSSRLVTEEKDGKYTGGKNYDSTGKQDSYYTDLKTNDYGIVYAGKQLFMNGKTKATFDMKYDGPNFIGGSTTDSTGKTDYKGSDKLNDKGYIIEDSTTTLVKDSTKTEVTTYKYDAGDDKGNWTVRTTYNDKGKITKVEKRVYTYYKD